MNNLGLTILNAKNKINIKVNVSEGTWEIQINPTNYHFEVTKIKA